MESIRRALWIAAFVATLRPGLVSATAGETDPRLFLEAIYRTYQGHRAKGVDFNGPSNFGKYFDAKLTQLYQEDQRNAAGEVPRLDGDPLVGGQEWDVTSFRVETTMKGADRAIGTVTLTNFGKPYVIRLDLVSTKLGWRISNVRWPSDKDSLLDVLAAPRK